MRKVGRAQRQERAAGGAEDRTARGYGDRMPRNFPAASSSGVALARAIVYNPKVLLMDEPPPRSTRKLREEMQVEIKHLQRELGITVIFVTHDQTGGVTRPTALPC